MSDLSKRRSPSPEVFCAFVLPDAVTVPQAIIEGQWKKAHGDYWFRVDAANPNIGLRRHVVVAHQKHLRALGKQVSWTDLGSKHDAGRFDTSFVGLEKAKEIARAALGLPKKFVLEELPPSTGPVIAESSGRRKTRVGQNIDARPGADLAQRIIWKKGWK